MKYQKRISLSSPSAGLIHTKKRENILQLQMTLSSAPVTEERSETSLQLYLRPHMIHKAAMNADMPINKMAFSPELRRFARFAETRRDSVEHTGTRGNAWLLPKQKEKQFSRS